MYMEIEDREEEGYQVFDGCYATVVGRCRKGVFLLLH